MTHETSLNHTHNMQENHRFDLIGILDQLRKRRSFIIGITVAATVLGALSYLLSKKSYKATSEFLISSYQYTDRQNLYRQDRASFIGYFASEDDIDKLMALAASENVKDQIIKNTALAQHYKLHPDTLKQLMALRRRFKMNFEAKRTDLQNMTLSFTDKDPLVAARVANEAVAVLGDAYGSFFARMRHSALGSIQAKMHEADSSINVLTDSLAQIRDRYHIYDVFSGTNPVSNTHTGGGAGYGAAIEQVRNIESIKDQLVTDRARMTSLATEFSTGSKASDLPLIQVISPAITPDKPAGLGFALTVIACALAALFFSSLWVLMTGYYRMLSTASR